MPEIVRTIRRELKNVYPKDPIYMETTDDDLGRTVKIFVRGKLKHEFIIDYQQYFQAASPQEFILETIREQIRPREEEKPNGG